MRVSWEIEMYRSIFNFRDTVIYFYVSVQYVDMRLQEKRYYNYLFIASASVKIIDFPIYLTCDVRVLCDLLKKAISKFHRKFGIWNESEKNGKQQNFSHIIFMDNYFSQYYSYLYEDIPKSCFSALLNESLRHRSVRTPIQVISRLTNVLGDYNHHCPALAQGCGGVTIPGGI